ALPILQVGGNPVFRYPGKAQPAPHNVQAGAAVGYGPALVRAQPAGVGALFAAGVAQYHLAVLGQIVVGDVAAQLLQRMVGGGNRQKARPFNVLAVPAFGDGGADQQVNTAFFQHVDAAAENVFFQLDAGVGKAAGKLFQYVEQLVVRVNHIQRQPYFGFNAAAERAGNSVQIFGLIQ